MYREKEVKYDVPLDRDEERLLKEIEPIIREFGFLVIPKRTVSRLYEYYDTPHLPHFLVFEQGETIRSISHFNPPTEKGLYRYDYKKGPLTERYEENYWTNTELSAEEMQEKLKFPKSYLPLEVVVSATTLHRKMVLQRNETKIELALDYFTLSTGAQFKELELECKNGDDRKNVKLGKRISEVVGLMPLEEQKYTRIVKMLQ